MKILRTLIIALCLTPLAACASTPAVPSKADAVTSAPAEKPAPSESDQTRAVVAILRAQRDANAVALQDTQLQLQFALAEVEKLKQKLAGVEGELGKLRVAADKASK